MKTNNKWHPPTLNDALNKGERINLNHFSPLPNKPKKLKYICHCGTAAWPFQFDDVRHIDRIEDDFICDGCYTKLERELTDIDGTGKPKTTQDFKQRFIKLQGAPEKLQDAIGKKFNANDKQKNTSTFKRGLKKWLSKLRLIPKTA